MQSPVELQVEHPTMQGEQSPAETKYPGLHRTQLTPRGRAL